MKMVSQIVRRLSRSRLFSAANPSLFDRSFSSESNVIRATLFPGDGIGPEITESVKQDAVLKTIAEGKYIRGDLGGEAKTTEFTNAICDHL